MTPFFKTYFTMLYLKKNKYFGGKMIIASTENNEQSQNPSSHCLFSNIESDGRKKMA